MSFTLESSKESQSQDTDALDHNLGRVDAEGRPGPVAGWFVQKPSPSRNYNEGKAILLFALFHLLHFLNDADY